MIHKSTLYFKYIYQQNQQHGIGSEKLLLSLQAIQYTFCELKLFDPLNPSFVTKFSSKTQWVQVLLKLDSVVKLLASKTFITGD